MIPLALALFLTACAPYRLPRHTHGDGSLSNRVIYAYFALTYDPYHLSDHPPSRFGHLPWMDDTG